MGRWTLLACLSGLFNLRRLHLASRDSSFVSEEELLEVVWVFNTLSWLVYFVKETAGLFASSSSFWATISKAVQTSSGEWFHSNLD